FLTRGRWGRMIRAIALAFGDLANRRILAILLQALAVTAVIFVLIGLVLAWLLAGADPCGWVDASCPLDAGEGGIGALLLTLLAAWFLFPGVAIGVITGFADRISAAVEQRHYPAAAAEAHPIGIGRAAAMGLRSALRILLFNLLALPFYLLLLVTGIGPFVLFVIVNGLAFGRDLGELAAARHGDRASRRAWLRSTRGEQGLMGTIVSAMFLVPVLNLVAPVVGTAMAIHLYNRRPVPPGASA
ncbi:MAG: EI24 domain-containing protein, partial [Sphingomicrobium sp.]